MSKLIYAVGVNDADYKVSTKISGKTIKCEYYSRWHAMLTRCYGSTYPTYIGCSVDPRWYSFMSFKAWMEKQDWNDKFLDKDILFTSNKIYGPDTCVFVSREVNLFITDSNKSRGVWPVGVRLHRDGKFEAQISANNRRTYLGLFDTPEAAYQAWYKRKRELAIELAAQQTDPRVAAALIARFP
jgi:hypothetical protein